MKQLSVVVVNISRILGLVIFVWGGSLLGGCTQTPAPDQSSDRSEVQGSQATQPEPTAAITPPDPDNPVEKSEEEAGPALASAEVRPMLVLVAGQISTLEPYQMVRTHPEESIASHIWDTLTLVNEKLQVEPHLAESWGIVNNFTWEFKLRRDVTFHNGEPFKAEAVRFSIERARSLAGSLETFAADVNLERVEVIDDYTVQLTTRQPVANLPYHLAFLEILPPVYYAEHSPNQVAVAPMGSGSYRIAAWQPGEPVILEALPHYWKGTPALPRLMFQTMPQAEKRLAALRQGQAALVTDLPPLSPEQAELTPGGLEVVESTQRMFVGIRSEEGSPLADKRVRQALNYGVNVEQLVDDWTAGYGKRYGSWVTPPADNPELIPWPYDPDRARALLAEAGYRTGFTATLRTPVGIYYHDVEIASALAQQLGQIGVTVEVKAIDNWDIYVQELLTNKSASLFLLALNSHGDGLEDVKSLSSSFPFNPTGWQNETFEAILASAVNSFNEDSRSRLLREAQSIAYDDAPLIWLWRPYHFYGVNQDLDWTPRPDGLVYLYQPE